jgi:flagellin
MRVNHNLSALVACNAVTASETALQKSIRRLSTGLRINTAADDAAGLAISEKMTAQVRGLVQALRNSQDGISMIQTAEGALEEIHSMLQRMRELSVQAANDTLTAQDRSYIQLEIDQLKEAIDRTVNTTQFNKKRLLNGDAAVLWSSDKLTTEVFSNAGLLSEDSFHQKVSAEGNYRIEVTAFPGQGQVQKSNIVDAEYDVVGPPIGPSVPSSTLALSPDEVIDLNSALLQGTGWEIDVNNVLHITGSGNYEITGASTLLNLRVVVDASSAGIILNDATITSSTGSAFDIGGADVTLVLKGSNTVTSGTNSAGVRAASGSSLTIYGDGQLTAQGTSTSSYTGGAGIGGDYGESAGTITINGGTINAYGGGGDGAGIGGGGGPSLGNGGNGGVITINGGTVTARGGTSSIGGAGIGAGHYGNGGIITINGGTVNATGGGHGSGLGGAHGTAGTIIINGGGGIIQGKSGTANSAIGGGFGNKTADITLKGEYDNSSGQFTTANGTFELKPGSPGGPFLDGEVQIQDLDYAANRIGRTFREMGEFYTETGTFTLEDPRKITIYQGDGKSVNVTLFASDTLREAAKKINDAIAFGLGQAAYVEGVGAMNFCTVSDGTEGTSESILTKSGVLMTNPAVDLDGNIVAPGQVMGYEHYFSTLLVRSALPGAAGELTFSGDEDFLNALGLSTIQESRESQYIVSVWNAHTGALVEAPQIISGNRLQGILGGAVDVRFDLMANTAAVWNESAKRYDLIRSSESWSTIIHITDNATVLQTGANEGENLILAFAGMSASALRLDGLLVVSRQTASRAITRLDAAIGVVSRQRAKLGAYQNRLEHSIASLTATGTNLTAAESRIKDADMAQEMMNMVRLQILLQSGTTMLGQANQLPQNVLNLIR